MTRPIIAIAFFLLLTAAAAAQTTEDVCRETQKVMEQYRSEKKELDLQRSVKGLETDWRKRYAQLNVAASNKGYIDAGDLEIYAHELKIDYVPKDSNGAEKRSGYWTVEERAAVQRAVRNRLSKVLTEVAGVTMADLNERDELLQQQIGTREQRMRDLRCNDLPKAGDNSGSTSFAGKWEGTAGDGRFREIWTISGSGTSYTISGEYLDKKTNAKKGGFTASNVKYTDGKLSFHQTFSPKPDPGWANN
ncbi:MAG TPA: hypothetical protein VEV84_00435, partial [Pyrinomonadaceae bacterium]|nr:hypothetical protein [Pyrinomonadaceae bacterium]